MPTSSTRRLPASCSTRSPSADTTPGAALARPQHFLPSRFLIPSKLHSPYGQSFHHRCRLQSPVGGWRLGLCQRHQPAHRQPDHRRPQPASALRRGCPRPCHCAAGRLLSRPVLPLGWQHPHPLAAWQNRRFQPAFGPPQPASCTGPAHWQTPPITCPHPRTHHPHTAAHSGPAAAHPV